MFCAQITAVIEKQAGRTIEVGAAWPLQSRCATRSRADEALQVTAAFRPSAIWKTAKVSQIHLHRRLL